MDGENGHKLKKNKKQYNPNKYVLGPDGQPLRDKDGHKIRVKKEPKKESTSNGHSGHGDMAKQGQKKIKSEPSSQKTPNKVKKEPLPAAKRKAATPKGGPKPKVKKEEKPVEKWKWWEENQQEKLPEGRRWKFLEHKGPVFAPAYVPLPSNIRMKYKGTPMELSEKAEEVMTFYAKMLNHDYVTKEDFNRNFFHDWRKEMTNDEKQKIQDLGKCDFTQVHEHFLMQSQLRKERSKEEKQAEKKKNETMVEEYGFCNWDHHKEKIGNFKLEPPGLFRGRGEHPKMGKLKKRIRPEDVTINCSKDSVIPTPPAGHRWKEVRHDDTVTWLVTWTENIQGQNKYIMLNPNSRIKGEKDFQKYEVARKLKDKVKEIRDNYVIDLKNPKMMIRQRAVALYFIDKLALRAGNEKDGDESADTVGCCSLRCEHITLHKHLDGSDYVVEFDFLGKDSIRYYNKVAVIKQVFKNLTLFMENKQGPDDLFDRLTTVVMNKYLQDLMPGLTAKVFRTYNASITLQNQLELLSAEFDEDESVASKILCYNRANRSVAVLCNHQRAAPKNFSAQMERMQGKINKKQDDIQECVMEVKRAKADFKASKSDGRRKQYEAKKRKLERLKEQLQKLEVAQTDKEENKEIALGTSKLNYLDPRITVAWCKKYNVPIEKCYNKTQRDKFAWAVAMVEGEDDEYEF